MGSQYTTLVNYLIYAHVNSEILQNKVEHPEMHECDIYYMVQKSMRKDNIRLTIISM